MSQPNVGKGIALRNTTTLSFSFFFLLRKHQKENQKQKTPRFVNGKTETKTYPIEKML